MSEAITRVPDREQVMRVIFESGWHQYGWDGDVPISLRRPIADIADAVLKCFAQAVEGKDK